MEWSFLRGEVRVIDPRCSIGQRLRPYGAAHQTSAADSGRLVDGRPLQVIGLADRIAVGSIPPKRR